ncbi:MAG: polyketide cyclase, partial [Fidelibacterota bacterium]
WAGNDQVGSGSQEITGIDAPNRLETKLVFNEPYESEATSYINLKSVGQTTRVTWGFEADIPYPFNFIMIFMNNEKAMDKEFGKGLTSLKAICES